MYYILLCFICRPLDAMVGQEAIGSNPGLLQFSLWQLDAPTNLIQFLFIDLGPSKPFRAFFCNVFQYTRRPDTARHGFIGQIATTCFGNENLSPV
jgi:hypothetical protein